jgi:predicted nucleic-acid-binding protein
MKEIHLIGSELLESFFTGYPENRAKEARSLISEAAQGNVILEILPMSLFKLIYDLEQLYQKSPDEIQNALSTFLRSKGIQIRDGEVIFKALRRYRNMGNGFEQLCLDACSEVEGKKIAKSISMGRR